jgi:hypothetical protein
MVSGRHQATNLLDGDGTRALSGNLAGWARVLWIAHRWMEE